MDIQNNEERQFTNADSISGIMQDEIRDAVIDTEKITLYLTFELGNELYGIPVSSVKEVMEYSSVYKTPGVPDYIRGVINLRGEVVPVIDLSVRFYSVKSLETELACIVVVEVKEDNDVILVGVMIDRVRAVTGILESNIEAAPEIGTRIKADYIEAIGKVDGQFVILVKVDTVLNIQELSSFDSVVKKRK